MFGTESFDFDDYYRKYYKRAIPLFAIDPKRQLQVFTAESRITPGPAWTLVSLVEPEQKRSEGHAGTADGALTAAGPDAPANTKPDRGTQD